MGDEKVNIKVNFKVLDQSRIKHSVLITNVTKKNLKLNGKRYELSLKFGNNRQKLEINLSFLKDVIDNREDLRRDMVSIKFKDEHFKTEIERIYSINMIKELNNMYLLNYESTQFQIRSNVNNQVSKDYFESKILPQIKNKKKVLSRIPQQKIHKNKVKKQPIGKLSPEELRKIDFYYSDLYAYKYSPNSDGNRKKREKFGGNGSNMRRRGKRI
ncbi:hypothetical protein [Ornithinibacillus halotolerans]|uniref:Uncharacterized protein n=1 Tax=Ornithinibacillus halotolerans TaxID=1274357 RepID=A0A916SAF8_9BACI|nr:hypothetical protein [Ornithinibacillus halotolerans]GGA91720.1 hypothetical protein GCM10008025_37760 [Ornithinibacillus halotolerans]